MQNCDTLSYNNRWLHWMLCCHLTKLTYCKWTAVITVGVSGT